MADYIRREDALFALRKAERGGSMTALTRLERAYAEIREMPAADVAEVVQGRWISFLDGDHIMPERYYRCSRCGRVESRRQPYCHCGAKMDGAAE